MSKIIKKIFKTGNYGQKGIYTKETFQKWVEEGKEFSVVPGHIGDWIRNGYAKTAIPIGGKVKCSSVDEEGFLYGEIQYNEFGKKVTEGGAYENFSIGLKSTGEPDHLALLGYMPPHIKELDKAFSEFSGEVEEVEYIEFVEGDPKEKIITLEEVAEFLKGVDVTETNKRMFQELQEILWKKMDQVFWAEKLKEEGYTVTKEFSEPKTEDQLREEIRGELLRDTERKALRSKISALVPPSMRGIMEFAVDQAFEEKNYVEIIEFSEEEKTTMKDHLEKMVEKGGPFKNLFREFNKEIDYKGNEFSQKTKTADEISNEAKKLMEEVG